MPKRPRQSHVPQQARKRKPRRGPVVTPADIYLVPEAPAAGSGLAARNPAGPIALEPEATGRQAEPARGRRADARVTAVRQTGQLPIFERAYLVNELRQIGITAAGLFGLIVILTILLR